MPATPDLSADPLDILLKHDRWANRRVLVACQPLTPAQFQQTFEIGPGSLHDTLAHVIGAMRRWADRLTGRPLRAAIDKPPRNVGMASEYRLRTPREFIDLLELAADELAQIAAKTRDPGGVGLASILQVQFGNNLHTMTRGSALVHVTTHGAHHRAQCLNMLRRLGVKDLPEVMVVDWQGEVEGGVSAAPGR